MSPITHLFVSWVVANTADLNRRERACVTLAGVIPDADGLGIIAEVATRNSDHPLTWWSDYHHVLCHNIGFCLLVMLVCFAVAKRRWLTAMLAFTTFHLHLLCDLVGARGPDGNQWPIPHLLPFSNSWQLVWSGQWALNAWQNILITGIAIVRTIFLAWKRGYSPLEMISSRADQVFVKTLRKRFS
jgi:inner membrane protein